jgi:hypothetical protein
MLINTAKLNLNSNLFFQVWFKILIPRVAKMGGSSIEKDVQGCHASGRPRARPADVRTRPTIPRTSALAAVRQPCLPSSKAVRRRRTAAPSAGGRPQLPSTGSRPPPPSIWGRPPAPSALYDSNFSFLYYVFVSLIAVTWSNSILKKLVENSL